MEENQWEISSSNISGGRIRQATENSQPVQNAGFTLVSSVLTGGNYLVWSRAIKFALGSRKKLSFRDGRSIRLADDSDELDEWIRIDYMVITWILNTTSKEIVDAFIYVSSDRSLWLKLEARYGGSNGQMIYNLEREIASVSQDTLDGTTTSCTKGFLHGAERGETAPGSDKKRKGTGGGSGLVAAVDDTLQAVVPQLQGSDLTNVLRTEIRKLMAEGSCLQPLHNTPFGDVKINFAQLEDMEGSSCNIYNFNDFDCGSWIVDSGATRHMCANLKHFTNYFKPS
ncbi:UNVERIFIED_CONTAM: hypothetical protein Sradi_2146500 [Sesamum radiatum]|uniref:Retrotransposon Copia-like N-terminal domain-containing protein n=1 Tax=Sesamum radiatum TaxID=300843 RepID=A0AAW2TKF1_SESRA